MGEGCYAPTGVRGDWRRSMRGGILFVDKPLGWTSFDVVAFVRRGTGEKRVGHGGTLDPAATGVLLVLVGQAARVTEYLMDLPKTYRATVRLGIETNTYDSEGEVTAERAVDVSEAQLLAALDGFRGEIEQVPPAFSAVKVGGQRAYALARKGEEVTLKARKATVYRLDMLRFDSPDVEIEVECSRGTYVRSLAFDLGRALGCGAHLAALERTRIGPFAVGSAASEAMLRAAFADGSWRELMQPIDCGLLGLPALTLGVEDEKDVRNGRVVSLDVETTARLAKVVDGMEARGYAGDGSLIGILAYDGESGMWRPRKVFAAEGG